MTCVASKENMIRQVLVFDSVQKAMMCRCPNNDHTTTAYDIHNAKQLCFVYVLKDCSISGDSLFFHIPTSALVLHILDTFDMYLKSPAAGL